MKLEIGQFIRTNYGNIDKILKLNESYVKGVSQKDEFYAYNIDNISKASYNIIDILEEGDYVNGCKVVKNTLKNGGNIVIVQGGNCFTNKEIKSVITHEQMGQMAYKVDNNK